MKTAWAFVKAFFLTLIGMGNKENDDAAKQAGRNEQVIADDKANAAAQSKIDATPYPDDLSSRLQHHDI